MELDGIKVYDTYVEWKRNSLLTTSLHAWNYQQEKVDLILRSFNKEVAQQVLYSRDGLKAKLEQQNKDISEAQNMARKDIQTIEELEQRILDLEVKLKEKNDESA